MDNEGIESHDTHKGKRISRGLFRTSTGKIINADLNTTYNMIRKAFLKAFADGIEGMGLHPRSLSIRHTITSKGGC
ncbi:MAG: hypothetical protein QXN66_06385 [Thermoplasmatales archaeon]